MKKFLITNIGLKFNFDTESNLKFNFEKSEENYIDIETGFIFQGGTFFYDGITGKNALKKFYNEFNENLKNQVEKMQGNYFICLKKNNNYYFFSDSNAILKTYYYINENRIIFGNILYDVINEMDKIKVNQMNLLESSFQYSILNNETFFDKVNVMSGDYILKINNEFSNFEKLKKEKIKINLKNEDTSEVVNRISKKLRERATMVAKNYKNIAINMTGGLDSRLVLSSYLSAGIKPTLIYGVGNSLLTNTFKQDLKIVKMFSEKYNLKLIIMDWTNGIKIMDTWKEGIEEFGEYAIIYGGNKNVINGYKKLSKEIDYFEFGYFGEAYRNIEWLDEENKNNIELDLLLKKYKFKNYSDILHCSDEFLNHLGNKVIENVGNKQIINKDDFIKFNIKYRFSADTKMTNFINLFSNSSIMLGEDSILQDTFLISSEYKRNSKLIIELLKKLDKSVLEIPIFSHCEIKKIDISNSELINKKINLSRKIPKLLKKIKSIKDKIILKNFLNKNITNLEKEFNINLIKNIQTDLRAYVYYLFNLFLIKQLKDGNINIKFEEIQNEK